MSTIFLGYDLSKRYAEFNKAYFDDSLPTIPLSFKPMQTMGGVVTFDYFARTRTKPNGFVKKETIKLSLDNTFRRSQESLDGILLHEMIHVHFAANDDWRENHGLNFEFMRRDLQKKSGIKIPRRDRTDDLEVTEPNKIGVIWIESSRPVFIPVREQDMNNADLKRYCRNLRDKYHRYVIQTPLWSKTVMGCRVKRSFIDPIVYVLSDDLLADLKANGTKVR